jgi:acyl carrier protein
MVGTELQQEIREFVIGHFLFGQDNGLSNTSSFLDHGIIDSTGVLELVAHIEGQYGVKIADDELVPDNLDSIESVARFIQTKRGALL